MDCQAGLPAPLLNVVLRSGGLFLQALHDTCLVRRITLHTARSLHLH